MTDPIPANLLVQTAACDERLQKLQIRAFANVGDNLTGEVILAVREVVAMVETLEKSRTIIPAAPQVAGGVEPLPEINALPDIIAGIREDIRVARRVGVDNCAVYNTDVEILCDAVESIPELERQLTAARNCHRIVEEQKVRLSKAAHSAREAERESQANAVHARTERDMYEHEVDRLKQELADANQMLALANQVCREINEAPTPAAPCGNADLVSELQEFLDCVPWGHPDAQYDADKLRALNLMRGAIAALAETKAVES